MSIGAGDLGNLPGAETPATQSRRFVVKFDYRAWKVRLKGKAMKAFQDKSPAETPVLEFDCSDALGDGVTIEQPTVVASQLSTRGATDANPDSIRVDAPTLNTAKTSVLQKVNGGLTDVTYKFKVTYSTSDNRTLEGAASLRVRDL